MRFYCNKNKRLCFKEILFIVITENKESEGSSLTQAGVLKLKDREGEEQSERLWTMVYKRRYFIF